jgi:Holliday junction resolvasome RuvABC endonuclease subunit
MAVYGIRFSNTDFSFCILTGDGDAPTVHDSGRVAFPKGYSEPELLKWLHQEIAALLQRQPCDAMAIKRAEGTVKRSNALETRVQAGAIGSLAAAQMGCNRVYRKMNSTIAKDLGLKGKGNYLKTKLDTSVIEDFDSYPAKTQEAILVAWSCM